MNISELLVLFEFCFLDLVQRLAQFLNLETLLIKLDLCCLRLNLNLFKFNFGVLIMLLELALEEAIRFDVVGKLHNSSMHFVKHAFDAVTMEVSAANLLIADEMQHESEDVLPLLLMSIRGRN